MFTHFNEIITPSPLYFNLCQSLYFVISGEENLQSRADQNCRGQLGQLHLIHPIYLYLAHVRFDGPTIFLIYSLSCIPINRDYCNLERGDFLEQVATVETQAILSYISCGD